MRDDVLDNVTLFGLDEHRGFRGVPVVARTFPDDLSQALRRWVEKGYLKLLHSNKLLRG
jgi:hypothetical protein